MPRARQYGPRNSRARVNARKTVQEAVRLLDRALIRNATDGEKQSALLGITIDGRINMREFPLWLALRQYLAKETLDYWREKYNVTKKKRYNPIGPGRLTREEVERIMNEANG